MILLGPPYRIASTKNAKELHRFAKKIGLKRSSYVKLNEDGSRGYYDIKAEIMRVHTLSLQIHVLHDDPDSLKFWEHLTT